ncbi:Dolichyl-phosphate-mannose-protein mannosyltransferase-domain-containing protein [Choanephora cucurbitarum]|nr:Dolichyl-phosphate-mannose-protein mannosyltransferase-domain-containing protein [Choanephora cucurbitarum]
MEDDEKYGKKHHAYKEFIWADKMQDHFRLFILTCLGLYLRVMNLEYPAFVVESELETTRQVNWYMASKFFIGKFPPLLGMVASGVTRIVGYYGTEDLIYSGQPFTEFPIVTVRRFSALLGALLIPLCYLTLRNMNHSRSSATMAAALLVFENGIVTQSRYATPEIYVLFFSALTTCLWTYMHTFSQESQNMLHMSALQTATGISMGCAISSKWTGILVFPMIWSSIVIDTWYKMCDKKNRIKPILIQIFGYLFTVGLVPLAVYLSIFCLHLQLIPNKGDHDLSLSTKLRYSLEGNNYDTSQPDIAYGSQIVIKHEATAGGYLHSHKKRFSGGSTQQEVTLYPHIDLNNIWTVHKAGELWNTSQPLEKVHNRDMIRLEHFSSSRKLHSHDVRPQISNRKEHSEVTAYGDKFIADHNDFWVLHIIDEQGYPSLNTSILWKPLEQRFRLQHIRGCSLISHNVYYAPPEGENHQEVTCMASAHPIISNWIVESAFHDKLQDTTLTTYDNPTLLQKIQEIHVLMYDYTNMIYDRLKAGGKSDTSTRSDDSNNQTPSAWLLKRTAMPLWNLMVGNATYMTLNPVVQRASVTMIAVYFGYFALYSFLAKRQMKLPSCLTWLNATGMDAILHDHYTKSFYFFLCAFITQAVCLRFLPHHILSMPDILSAVYYGIGLTGVMLEACTNRWPSFWRRLCLYGLLLTSIIRFTQLSHLSYGGHKWTRSECEKSQLDIDCYKFPPDELERQELIKNNGNSSSFIFQLDLPLRSESYKYDMGEEAEADKNVAILKQAVYLKEAQKAAGIYRYHRVLPTPGISAEEAATWAEEVTEGGFRREEEARRQQAEELQKKQEEEQAANSNQPVIEEAIEERA